MGKKAGQIKTGQTLGQTNVQTPLLPLSGTRKVVRTPTNPFEAAGTVEVFVPKEIIARRIQAIFAGPNKGRKAEHYLVVWEDYPLKKDYTWEPIENLYGHEDLAQTYEQWLKTENERLDSVEAERKTVRKMTAQKVQDVAADQFRKNDKFTKKAKGTDNTSRQTLHQEVEQDEAEAAADGDENAVVLWVKAQRIVKILMIKEVLVKVLVRNAHADVSVRLPTDNRTWCKQSVASSVSVPAKPV
jgi:hypothetical protein